MTFKLRISLLSPIATTVEDITFEFDKELQAKDIMDMCKTICDKYSFETYDEYIATVDSISKILQGYEYSIKPIGRKEQKDSIIWLKKGKETKKENKNVL